MRTEEKEKNYKNGIQINWNNEMDIQKTYVFIPRAKNCPKAICSKFHILTHRHISSVKAMFHHQSGILAQKKNAGQPPTHRISKKKPQTTTQSP